ncbi:MAG: hypothetical protein HOL65_03945 [Microbacteriaceae bacterium]|nr:hypothetical protein [Microbacteriaceae bacterium]MBT5575949.1 hypothetical protein [Microbacteriaceae bacterium]
MNAAGAWAWHHTGVAVSSIEEVLARYTGLLGFEVVFEAPDMSDLIQSMTGVAGLRADLVQCRAPHSEHVWEFIHFRNIPGGVDDRLPLQPGRAHAAFLVPDIERAVWENQRAGGQMLGSITEFSEGRAVYCADASGTVIEWEEAAPGGSHG